MESFGFNVFVLSQKHVVLDFELSEHADCLVMNYMILVF